MPTWPCGPSLAYSTMRAGHANFASRSMPTGPGGPEPRVFDDARWPRELRNPQPVDRTVETDQATPLEEGYARAEEMLKPTPYPPDSPELPKLRATADPA